MSTESSTRKWIDAVCERCEQSRDAHLSLVKNGQHDWTPLSRVSMPWTARSLTSRFSRFNPSLSAHLRSFFSCFTFITTDLILSSSSPLLTCRDMQQESEICTCSVCERARRSATIDNLNIPAPGHATLESRARAQFNFPVQSTHMISDTVTSRSRHIR